MKRRGYIYISNLDYSGTVFQTQIIDWLKLYKENGIVFDLVQAFHVKDLVRRPTYIKNQKRGLSQHSNFYKGSIFLFPSKSFALINASILYLKIIGYILKYDELLIFSRAVLGKEISLLRKLTSKRILFLFDARAAAAEENKYVASRRNDFSLKRYLIIANVYRIVYQTLMAADRIFVVSNSLGRYFHDTYRLNPEKYVLYPCLSDSEKFYFSPRLRMEVRKQLGIKEGTRVFIYSGGISNEWHITERMFGFLDHLFKCENDQSLICLTKDTASMNRLLGEYSNLKSRYFTFSVPNHEVCKYLNAADYGILFRENTIMNNVASPTKFAEYMLCGLPVLISEGVGDYSEYIVNKKVGVLIREMELQKPDCFDYISFINRGFDRKLIADIGKERFSKASILKNLLEVFIS